MSDVHFYLSSIHRVFNIDPLIMLMHDTLHAPVPGSSVRMHSVNSTNQSTQVQYIDLSQFREFVNMELHVQYFQPGMIELAEGSPFRVVVVDISKMPFAFL